MNVRKAYVSASRDYKQGAYMSALRTLNQLLNVQVDTRTYALLAKTLLKIDLKSEAAATFALAGGMDGAHAEEYLRIAMNLHFECGEDDKALLIAKRFIHKANKDPEIAFLLASIFLKRGEKGILGGLRGALLESDKVHHLALAVELLAESPGDEDNLRTAQKLLQKFPNDPSVRMLHLIHAREFGELDIVERRQARINREIEDGNIDLIRKSSPFYTLNWCNNEEFNQMAIAGTYPFSQEATIARRTMSHEWHPSKIRIGYLSSDLWDMHATMKLLRNVLERHDRDRFDITLFCYTPERALVRNKANREEWGKIVSITNMSHAEAAETIRRHKIDVLVDLKGHTSGNRAQILNHMTAPVNVAWLGYPGSTVNVDIDYIVGDRFVLPDSSKPYYYEKFCRLPETYQPNDPVHRPLPVSISRSDAGLPEKAFIFGSFNHNRKITPDVVKLWAEILKKTPDSILWLMVSNPKAENNLLRYFSSSGIPSSRIFICPKVSYEQHLNRLQLVDLALDTSPYNGHTTTSEQLWIGLPVLTYKGKNFASRVSESLLNAIGLPELISEDERAYVEKAIWLYEHPDVLAEYKHRLIENRFVKPLFDAERFCRHLESAYETMVGRIKIGHDPDHFDVVALSPRETPFQPESRADTEIGRQSQ